MQLREAINNRRSIRKYKSDPVSQEHINEILESGMKAPSAGNLQSRFFYAVKEPALRSDLASAAFGHNFISQAPVTIVVCTDLRIESTYGERGTNLYAIMDCAASIQNMILTAHSLGLGSCWVGAFNETQVSSTMEIPPHLRPVAIIPLGYPAESPKPPLKVAFENACKFQ